MTELFLLGIIIGIFIAGYVIDKVCFNWNLIDEVLRRDDDEINNPTRL